MEMKSLRFTGVKEFTRGPTVTNITTGTFSVVSNNSLTDLTVPFDQLSILEVFYQHQLQRLQLPPQAVGWTLLDLFIDLCPKLDMTSQYAMYNGKKVQTWYWPQKDIKAINIDGNIGDGFL
jgi:hypothetical protein